MLPTHQKRPVRGAESARRVAPPRNGLPLDTRVGLCPGARVPRSVARFRRSWGCEVNEADNYWEIMAAVIPVIALAFVLEVRYLQFHRMGPFNRLMTALTHTATILVLLFSELAALSHVQGKRQAPWAEDAALYGCVAALSVILTVPATRLLLIAVYGTSWSTYRKYWQTQRSLRSLKEQVKQVDKLIERNKKSLRRNDMLSRQLSDEWKRIEPYDLATVWKKESLADGMQTLAANRLAIIEQHEELKVTRMKFARRYRKFERQLVKIAGFRTKHLMQEMNKHYGTGGGQL